MKILNPIIILLMALFCSANAEEVFKCKSSKGEIIYQPNSCPPNETTQDVLNIKEMTPQEVEAAKAKLKAEQEEEAAYDAAKAEEEKQRQREMQKQQELELERHRLMAQEKAAIEAERRRAWGPTYMPRYYGNSGGY